MPKHQYDRLYITSFEPRDFDPRDPLSLRKAVEYLKTLPPSPFLRLVVEKYIEPGTFKVNAPASMTLDQIIGKTPQQIWAIFDYEIDSQIEYFKSRS